MPDTSTRRSDTRTSIVEAAAGLLQAGGPAAVTTRGVAEAAGVQAPTIYRIFGDKDGLLDAVAEHVMATYVSAKAEVVAAAAAGGVDPLQDLREGWDAQIAFGLANPSLFRLLSDPDRVAGSPAALSGRRVLESRVRRVAETGRLRVGEQRAVAMIQAAGIGTIQTLLMTPSELRDPGLGAATYDAVMSRIVLDAPDHLDSTGVAAAAVALRAVAPRLEMLSGSERGLLADWLDRVIDGAQSGDTRS